MSSFATSAVTAQEVFPRGTMRKSLIFLNEDVADAIFLKRERAETPTVSTTDHDYRLGPGSSLSLNDLNDGKEAIQDRWTCIASANTPRLAFFETEDVKR
ncbi:MAG: hypothetical protein WC766_06420 [Patescibacteria group bacterium]|jgi:hypothetical protein